MRLISYAEMARVRERLERLSPYKDPGLFRLEPENLRDDGSRSGLRILTVSSKRYTLAVPNEDGVLVSVAGSEFALGHLLCPTDPDSNDRSWITEAWDWALGGVEPAWLDRPALSLIRLANFDDIARLRATDDAKVRAYVRPGGAFVVAETHQMAGSAEPSRVASPWVPGFDPEKAVWIDWDSARRVRRVALVPKELSESSLSEHRPVYLASMRSVLARHFKASENKSLGPNGDACRANTVGLLRPAPTEAYQAVGIGRETNYFDQVGITRSPEYVEFSDSARDESFRLALRVVKNLDRTTRLWIARQVGVSGSQFQRIISAGRTAASRRPRIVAAAAVSARDEMRSLGESLPADDGALLHLFTQRSGRQCAGCGDPLSGRQRRWCARCRKRAGRVWHNGETKEGSNA